MAIFLTGVHMVGGVGHEHIGGVKWKTPNDGKDGQALTADVIEWIETKKWDVRVSDGATSVAVGVVDHSYLRTHADGRWTNNLLSLPRY